MPDETRRFLTIVLAANDTAIAKSAVAKFPLFGEIEPGVEVIAVHAGDALAELDNLRELARKDHM